MAEAKALSPPVIHCTPSTDPAFLASVSRAYRQATGFLSGEAAVYVGLLVRLRNSYPMASIISLSLAGRDGPLSVWLVSRDGWTEIELRQSSTSGRNAETAGHAAVPRT